MSEIYTLSLHDALPICKIIINVQIENKSYRFLLDTGAATAISEKLQNSIKLHKLGNIKMTDQSGLTDSLEVVSVPDRKSTRLNSSHVAISYAVFCLKKK